MEKPKNKTDILIDVIAKKAPNLSWVPTMKSDTFQVSLSDYILKIEKKEGPLSQDISKYIFSICDAKGEKIDVISGTEGLGSLDKLIKLKKIFDEGRRKALCADEAINNILKEMAKKYK